MIVAIRDGVRIDSLIWLAGCLFVRCWISAWLLSNYRTYFLCASTSDEPIAAIIANTIRICENFEACILSVKVVLDAVKVGRLKSLINRELIGFCHRTLIAACCLPLDARC